jgi:hypothetical protein
MRPKRGAFLRASSFPLLFLPLGTALGDETKVPGAEPARVALDHGDRFDIDITFGDSASPALRMLLPEAIFAGGRQVAGGAHALSGQWARSEAALEGVIRPAAGLECILRLVPRREHVDILVAVKNTSRETYSDVRVDICANLCRLPRTWQVEWSNRAFIPERIPMRREEQGKYWFTEAARRLFAWSPESGWTSMRARPEKPDKVPEDPYEIVLGEGDSSLACAVASLDGASFMYQAWAARRSRHQAPFSGNACMHLRPQVAERLEPGQCASLRGAAGVFAGTRDQLAQRLNRLCARTPPVDDSGRPFILKHGTIDLDLVETTPVVFRDRMYRFEWVREGYWQNQLKKNHFRFIDLRTGEATTPFALDHEFGSAFAEGEMMYVTGTRGRREVHVFASKDLESWQSWPAVTRPGYGIFNTSVCKAAGEYVLMFEIDKPAEEAGAPFTARFAASRDFREWRLTPPECCYSKDRYTAPHCLRWLDGWFYDFYLEARDGYEMRVVRSLDLAHWEPSPLNPVLRASPEDKLVANPRLTSEQRGKVSSARNINNSDIDFCERDGRLFVNYSWGNQEGIEFLAEASYEGTLEDFLRGWFPRK